MMKYQTCKEHTVPLTGNFAGTRTTRHAKMRETRTGAGMLRGIASKTKSLTIANLPKRLLLRVLAQS